jgi:DNA-binding MarR family transcriptional regulator
MTSASKTPNEKQGTKVLRTVTEALDYFRREINNDIPVQQIIILLTVAENPGISQAELAMKVGMSPSSISRSVRMLARYLERGNDTEKGYGLIETRPDLRIRSRQACFLTTLGHKVIAGVIAILNRAGGSRSHLVDSDESPGT